MMRFSIILLSSITIATIGTVPVVPVVSALTNIAPDLSKLAPQIYQKQLRYQVAIGDKESPFQMNNLQVAFTDEKSPTPKKYSTGIHVANLLQPPSYITDKGEQFVELTNGGWEITWGPKSSHGHLTCSFVSTTKVQRTEDATLEEGRFFMAHRIWTKATLESERERRKKIQTEATSAIKERDQKIQQITDEDGSMGSKIISYAQAAKAKNDYLMSGYKEALYIPLHDDQVLELAPDCIVSSRGEIWKSSSGKINSERIGLSRVDVLEVGRS